MPMTVSGDLFHVVTCQSCENDLSFQKPQSLPRATKADELKITCGQCGHLGSYRSTQFRQARAQYPL
jgi:RNase P subunit RPR2